MSGERGKKLVCLAKKGSESNNYLCKSPTEGEISSLSEKINIISHYKLVPESDETYSLCSDSVESELQEDCVIPFNEITTDTLSHQSPLKNRICNVGFDTPCNSKDIQTISLSQLDVNDNCNLQEPKLNNNSRIEDVENVPESIDDTVQANTENQTDLFNPDRILINFGKIIKKNPQEPADGLEVEHFKGTRPWTKKNSCPYCFKEVTHFSRHLKRNHKEEGAVQKLSALPPKDPQVKVLLNAMRKQGNYLSSSQANVLRPVRRPKMFADAKPNVEKSAVEEKKNYIACNDCFGYFKKQYLRRHRKRCPMRSKLPDASTRENHLSEAQLLAICSGPYSSFYNSLRLKKEVFTIMRCDEISQMAMSDILICCYAEDLLGKHKRIQMRNVISNKMRELGRLLIELKKSTGAKQMIDVLKPEFFDSIVAATKKISGYNPETRMYKAGSLALHMGTTLRQLCDTASKTIIKKSPFLPCRDAELSLKNLKRIRSLLVNHWNTEVSSMALKNLNEQRWEKPKLFPLTSDIVQFKQYVEEEVKKACDSIKKEIDLKKQYRILSEGVLALTLLLNRKRIGEVQYLKVKTYNTDISNNQQEELLQSLTESEKLLTRNLKRVITGGKGSKPVPILFTKNLQYYIDIMLTVRSRCVPNTNEYLFANPKTDNRWISGYHTLKKLATQSGVKDTNLFTSTRLRKQIATVLQVLNVTETEMEQFANFMGHTKKTHETYYRLPQDVYQTAKVSKLLLAINKGQGVRYQGKTLEEIEFSDNVESDSESESESAPKTTKPNEKQEVASKTPKLHDEYHDSDFNYTTSLPSTSKASKTVTPAEKKTKKDTSEDDSSSDSASDLSDLAPPMKTQKIQRIRWTAEQKSVITSFFKNHIKQKKAPKKHEVEILMNKHKALFKGRDWVKIKAVVYNCYKK